MRNATLALKLLWRDWRSGELGLMLLSITLAVAIVTSITLFTERLQGALVAESKVFLAADLVVETPESPLDKWQQQAEFYALEHATTAAFPSVVFAGENMYLASVKAVTANYPLRGEVEIVRGEGQTVQFLRQGPEPGTAWVDRRLLGLLELNPGDELLVGEKTFTVSDILLREPDAGTSFASFAPRVMINMADLEATRVVMPGSRVQYRLLLAGNDQDISAFRYWIEPHLQKKHRLLDIGESQPGIARSLDRARDFMLLSGSLGVLLACIAVAMTSRRYFLRHQDGIAIMKTLGATPGSIGRLVLVQLGAIALLGIVPGFVIGYAGHQMFLALLSGLVPETLPEAGSLPFQLGALTGLVSVVAFCLPSLWQLKQVLPLRVLRRDMADTGSVATLWIQKKTVFGALSVWVLMLIYTRDIKLASLVFGGVLVALTTATLVAAFLFHLMKPLQGRGGALRLALGNLGRARLQTLVQVSVFGLALMLLLVAVLIRTSLFTEWRAQLPADTPNYFLINIADYQVEPLQQALSGAGIDIRGMYPMVRGRLTHINGQEATTIISEDVDELYRELNLTWSKTLIRDNAVTEGAWWTDRKTGAEVSIEARLAKRLDVGVGDELSFTIGDSRIPVRISSVRSLDWEKMQPNFYFIFPPGVIDHFPATWITSFYIPMEQKVFINTLIRQFPTVTFLEIDQLIARAQSIIEKVTAAVELVLWLILLAGGLVLLASVKSSLDRRLHENAILRALGARKSLLLGSLVWEFLLLGLLAGCLAALGGEFTVYLLQTRVFNMAYQPHLEAMFLTPLLGVLLITLLGLWGTSRVTRVSPLTVLREFR